MAKSRLGIEVVHLKFCITPLSVACQLFCVVIFFTQNSADFNKTTGPTVLHRGQFVGVILFLFGIPEPPASGKLPANTLLHYKQFRRTFRHMWTGDVQSGQVSGSLNCTSGGRCGQQVSGSLNCVCGGQSGQQVLGSMNCMCGGQLMVTGLGGQGLSF